ncbi:MAG TPA: SRPBCC domain-containing protein [Trebonia sp.]
MTDHETAGGLVAPDQDYQSQLTLTASPEVVFAALTTTEGLAAWWTPVTGDGRAGGELTFSFGPASQAVMRVDAAECGVAVRWTNLACMIEDWIGTTVHFDMEPASAGGTELRFRHGGLTPRLECYLDCKSGWDHFIPSLRAYVETGTGNPNGSQADRARRAVRAERRHSVGTS